MKKIELEIETYRYRLEEYLLSIDGITDVKKEERGYNFFITVTYDERKIFIERIEKEKEEKLKALDRYQGLKEKQIRKKYSNIINKRSKLFESIYNSSFFALNK